jgi:hypothetical protein
MYINLRKAALYKDVGVVVIKNLMYDVILGVDILRLINAKLDMLAQTLVCNHQGKSCSISLNDRRDEVDKRNDVTAHSVYRPSINVKSNKSNQFSDKVEFKVPVIIIPLSMIVKTLNSCLLSMKTYLMKYLKLQMYIYTKY